MDAKDFKRLSEGIILPPKDVGDMIRGCQLNYRKRKIKKKRMKIASICIVSFIFCICFGISKVQPEIYVYAATTTDNVKLQEDKEVILSKQNTPMGLGYKLEISIPKGGYTYTITDENSQYPQNVFHKENEIYWMPDGVGNNLRDSDGNVIELPKTDKTVINIKVMTKDSVKENFQLSLDKRDDVCTVTLDEISK